MTKIDWAEIKEVKLTEPGTVLLAKDLKLRSSVGPGIGYRFHDSKQLKLRTELGAFYLQDDFYEQEDESFWGPGWHLEYEQMVWKRRLQLSRALTSKTAPQHLYLNMRYQPLFHRQIIQISLQTKIQ
jgi:hypothetical protein